MDAFQKERWIALEEENYHLMLAQIRPAQPWEWAHWVGLYLRNGGTREALVPSSRPMKNFYVAYSNLTVRPLHGAKLLNVLLPPGISDDGGDTGHTHLWSFDEHDTVCYRRSRSQRRPRRVPVFSDTDTVHLALTHWCAKDEQ
jgi:hypothetical protein